MRIDDYLLASSEIPNLVHVNYRRSAITRALKYLQDGFIHFKADYTMEVGSKDDPTIVVEANGEKLKIVFYRIPTQYVSDWESMSRTSEDHHDESEELTLFKNSIVAIDAGMTGKVGYKVKEPHRVWIFGPTDGPEDDLKDSVHVLVERIA